MGGGEGRGQGGWIRRCPAMVVMICQWPCADPKNRLPSDEYGATTGRTVLERMVSRDWRRDLEMLQVMISKGYFLARRYGSQVPFVVWRHLQ